MTTIKQDFTLMVAPTRRAASQFMMDHPDMDATYFDRLIDCLAYRPNTTCNTVTVVDHSQLNVEQLMIVRELQRAGYKIIHHETPKS